MRLTDISHISDVPASMTQVTDISDTNNDMDSIFAVSEDNEATSYFDNNNGFHENEDEYNRVFRDFLTDDVTNLANDNDPINNPFRFLKMSFYEMTDVMKGILSLEELQDVKLYLNSVTHEMHKRHHEERNGVNDGIIVSSNMRLKKIPKPWLQ